MHVLPDYTSLFLVADAEEAAELESSPSLSESDPEDDPAPPDGERLDRGNAHHWVRSICRPSTSGSSLPHVLRASFMMAALDVGVPLGRPDAVRHAAPRTTLSMVANGRTSSALPPRPPRRGG